MRYLSTRGGAPPVLFTEAVAQGLAPDGGLYLPEEFPDLSPNIDYWENLSYAELCFEFFKHFATDIDTADLKKAVYSAYSNFTHADIAPLVRLNDHWQVLIVI